MSVVQAPEEFTGDAAASWHRGRDEADREYALKGAGFSPVVPFVPYTYTGGDNERAYRDGYAARARGRHTTWTPSRGSAGTARTSIVYDGYESGAPHVCGCVAVPCPQHHRSGRERKELRDMNQTVKYAKHRAASDPDRGAQTSPYRSGAGVYFGTNITHRSIGPGNMKPWFRVRTTRGACVSG